MEGLHYGKRFPSYGGSKVSVVLPTRGRPHKLKRAVDSLWQNACDLSSIEFFFRADDDDSPTLDYLFGEGNLPPNSTVLVGPRDGGYLDLHKHINAMAEVSRGDWIMNFNDDAVMLTKWWDRVFGDRLVMEGARDYSESFGCEDGIYLLQPRNWHKCEFFAVHRTVFNVLGHLSLFTGVDDWLYSVLGFLHRITYCVIEVGHENEEDETLLSGRRGVDRICEQLLSSSYVRRGKLLDTVKLIDYIEAFASNG